VFCDEVLDLIEPIAAGEYTPDGRVAAHLTTCPNCAAALVTARRVDQMLQRRAVPKPAPQFTTKTMALVRRNRWRRDQFLDAGFNLTLVVLGFAMIGAMWMALHRSGLIAVSNGTFDALGAGLGVVRQHVVSTVSIYVAATVLVATALGLWFWAERGTNASARTR
jgi:predicted anti-sigma-YlaC factor YlaD